MIVRAGLRLVVVLGVGVLVGWAVPRPIRGPEWLQADGEHWRRFSPEAKVAYAEGFLTGGALAQATVLGETDPAALRRTLDSLGRGGLRFVYAPNVYTARVDDYYWWENQRSKPIWHAFEEVNNDLKRFSR